MDKLARCAKIRQITKKGSVLVSLPEQQAGGNIDVLLEAAGWHVCDAPVASRPNRWAMSHSGAFSAKVTGARYSKAIRVGFTICPRTLRKLRLDATLYSPHRGLI